MWALKSTNTPLKLSGRPWFHFYWSQGISKLLPNPCYITHIVSMYLCNFYSLPHYSSLLSFIYDLIKYNQLLRLFVFDKGFVAYTLYTYQIYFKECTMNYDNVHSVLLDREVCVCVPWLVFANFTQARVIWKRDFNCKQMSLVDWPVGMSSRYFFD